MAAMSAQFWMTQVFAFRVIGGPPTTRVNPNRHCGGSRAFIDLRDGLSLPDADMSPFPSLMGTGGGLVIFCYFEAQYE